MCPSVARIGCKPKSRNEAVASGSGSCPVPLRCMPASHRASDDVEQDSGLTLSTPLRRPPMRLKSCCRRDDHRSCYDVRSGPPTDHPVHSTRPAATTSSSQPSSRCFLTEGARPSFRRSVRSGGGLHRLRSHHRPWWWTSDAAGRLAASMWRSGSTNDSGSMAMWTRVPYKARFEFSHFAELTETV